MYTDGAKIFSIKEASPLISIEFQWVFQIKEACPLKKDEDT